MTDIAISNLEPVLGGVRVSFRIYGGSGNYRVRVLNDNNFDNRSPLQAFTECAWDDDAPLPDADWQLCKLVSPTGGRVNPDLPQELIDVPANTEVSVVWQTARNMERVKLMAWVANNEVVPTTP